MAPRVCGQKFGKGLGGVQRTCHLPHAHLGRCTDMPFLIELKRSYPRVADKIERDSFNTRGASWGKGLDGTQKRRNRQPRWTLAEGHAFYPAHHQVYENCLVVAAELTLQAYQMRGAPACPDEISRWLHKKPGPNSGICPICNLPLDFAEFDLAEQSKAAIDTDHLNPGLKRRHAPGNVAFVHHLCNTTKGDRSLDEFDRWMIAVLERKGYSVNTMGDVNGRGA